MNYTAIVCQQMWLCN